MKGAVAVGDKVRALRGYEDGGTAVDNEWGVARREAGEASQVSDGVDKCEGRLAGKQAAGDAEGSSDAGLSCKSAGPKEGNNAAWIVVAEDGGDEVRWGGRFRWWRLGDGVVEYGPLI